MGIDLGGTKIEIAAVDQNYIQIFHKRVLTSKSSYEQTIVAIVNRIKCQQALGPADRIAIGHHEQSSVLGCRVDKKL